MINPKVTNSTGSQFVPIILGELSKKIGVTCSRQEVEEAVTNGRCGNISDTRYFLKDGVNVPFISGQPKSNLRKVRCCTIKKEVLSTDLLKRLNKGKNSTGYAASCK